MSESKGLPEWADDTFWLTLIGLLGGGGTAVLAYMLKSRCRTVGDGVCNPDISWVL